MICSNHFREDDFQELKDSSKRLLKQGVVPSIFQWVSADIIDSEQKKLTILADDHCLVATPSRIVRSTRLTKNSVLDKFGKQSEEDLERQVEETIEAIKAEIAANETSVIKPTFILKTNSIKTKDIQESGTIELKVSKKEAKLNKIQSQQNKIPVPESHINISSVCKPQKKKKKKRRTNTPFKKRSGRKENELNRKSKTVTKILSWKRNTNCVNFTPGCKIEAQDFEGRWHFAKVVEVDSDEGEVLVHFDKSNTIKTNVQSVLSDEWIPMDSIRLRPSQLKKKLSFTIGEPVMARWNDSRKFPATVQRIVSEDLYEVLFNDGYTKIVRSTCINKIKQKNVLSQDEPSIITFKPDVYSPTSQLNNILIPDIPKEGEWCCYWVNDSPVGKESYLEMPHGILNTIIVEDWRLPEGWTKHLYQRTGNFTGKWETILESPDGHKFRTKAELKLYLDEEKLAFDSTIYDFCLHKKRAKEVGLVAFTDDFKDSQSLKNVRVNNFSYTPLLNTKKMQCDDEVFIGALKVKRVDNLFICPDCEKSFRKENHLQIHIKHYHFKTAERLGVVPNMQDLAYIRTADIDESEVQADINMRFMRKSLQTVATSLQSDTMTFKPALEENVSTENKSRGGFSSKSSSIKFESDITNLTSLDPENVIITHSLNRASLKNKYKAVDVFDNSHCKKMKVIPSLAEVQNNFEFEGAFESNNLLQHTLAEKSYVNEFGEMIKIVRMRKEEVINCLCTYFEEDGLMIQCELCLCWQHGICNGILKESQVPDKYVCVICRNPERGRPSMRFIHDQDWLYDGKLTNSSYHFPSQNLIEDFNWFRQINTINGHMLELHYFLQSLKVKMNVTENKHHPKMYLWSKEWGSQKKRNLSIQSFEEYIKNNNELDKKYTLKIQSSLKSCTRNNIRSLVSSTLSSVHNKTLSEQIIERNQIKLLEEKYDPREAAIDPIICQKTLLAHIQKHQNDAMARLQTMETQIFGEYIHIFSILYFF